MLLVSVIVLGVLVFVHELGHFLVAKFFRVGVLEFAIGFGPKVYRRRFGETWYSIRCIPLGGYVRMVGDTPTEVLEAQRAQPEEEGAPEPEELDEVEKRLWGQKERWFLSQRIFPRILIVAAGPAFNLLFAFLLATFSFYVYGLHKTVNTPVIGEVIPEYPADKAGLRKDDTVLAVNGQHVHTWLEMAMLIANSGGSPVTLQVQRPKEGGVPEDLTLTIEPQRDTPEMELLGGKGKKSQDFKIGIFQNTERIPATLLKATTAGASHVYFLCEVTLKSLYGMVNGIISPSHIAGPIFIFKEAAKSARSGLDRLFDFMIFLSVSLAILNLLPVPILDGGHILFFLIEAIKGRPVSIRIQEYANQFGMLMLLLLMLFAVGNDIRKLFL